MVGRVCLQEFAVGNKKARENNDENRGDEAVHNEVLQDEVFISNQGYQKVATVTPSAAMVKAAIAGMVSSLYESIMLNVNWDASVSATPFYAIHVLNIVRGNQNSILVCVVVHKWVHPHWRGLSACMCTGLKKCYVWFLSFTLLRRVIPNETFIDSRRSANNASTYH